MIVITKLVSLEEFDKLRKDSSYTKLELHHNKNKNTRDIKVNCYLKYDTDNKKSTQMAANFIKTLKNESNNKNLPNNIRELFGGWYSYVIDHNGWIKYKDFKVLLEFEKIYNLNLNIPNKFKKLIINY